MTGSQDAVRLYYKNVMADAIGSEDGLTRQQMRDMAERVAGVIEQVEAERKQKHRYRELPYDTEMLNGVQAACDAWRTGCENLVVCGIGGSALGNIALQTALNPCTYNMLPAGRRKGPRLFVMDNVDPMQFGALLDLLGDDLDATVFNVISKSGETAETASQFLIVRDMLARRFGPDGPTKHILVTTGADGTMRDIVEAEKYESLPVPEGVGGRFSALSAVGLFSAGMCGIDIAGLLRGAAAMDERVKVPELERNPAAMIAVIHVLMMARGKPIHVMMPYSYHLKDLADWFRQLWAESLGKKDSLDGQEVYVGPTPIKALGVTDQHSQVQLYREGPNDKVFTLLAVEEFDEEVTIPEADAVVQAMDYLGGKTLGTLLNNERRATEQALVDSKRPTLSVRFPKITAETVGEFIYLYEAATTIAGRLLNIDPYNQPAVELGKIYTFALMGRRGCEDTARKLQAELIDDETFLV